MATVKLFDIYVNNEVVATINEETSGAPSIMVEVPVTASGNTINVTYIGVMVAGLSCTIVKSGYSYTGGGEANIVITSPVPLNNFSGVGTNTDGVYLTANDPYSIKIATANGIKLLTKDKDIHFDDDVKITIDESLLGGGGVEIPVDNGPIYEGKYRVRYFDVDGTILKIEYVADGGKTTPPDDPAYDPDYLIFDEWNYDTANYIVEGPTDIGAIYKTVDDATYMWCRFTTKTGFNPTLAITGFTSIDWGDGTVNTSASHTYAKEGYYLIKIIGNISYSATTSSTYLCGSNNLNQALQKCYIKNGITSIGDYMFHYCYSLTRIAIPNSITSIGVAAFQSCYSLINIIIPNGITSIETDTATSCYSLRNIIMPNSITSIGESSVQNCYGLKELIMPKGITNIGSYVFWNCRSLQNYFINCDTIPVLSNTNSFQGINYSTIMWVNESIIDQLKVATNWSNYANLMKPLSWYPHLTDPNT